MQGEVGSSGRAVIVCNIPNFEMFPKRGKLVIGNSLVGNKYDFEADAGPDQEPVKFPAKVY